MSDCPVGAKWRLVTSDGASATVELDRRVFDDHGKPMFEMWLWQTVGPDGSEHNFGYTGNKASASEEAKCKLTGYGSLSYLDDPQPRFNRVRGGEND